MKNYILTFFGLLLSIIGVISFFLISNSRHIGMFLMIFGFLIILINLIFVLKKMHEKRKIYKRKLRNSELT